MKKKILSLLLVMIMIFNAISTFPLQIVAEDETTGINIADMEVGKLYAAKFDYTYDDFVPYKPDSENGESLMEWKGINDGVAEDDAYVSKADFPQDLIVKRMFEYDLYYLYVANEDWPADYNEYRYVHVSDLIVTGEYVVPPDDDGLIYGEVGLVMDGEVVNSLTIAQGEKTYVFTELSDKIEGTPIYQWQTLVDKEEDRWATILYYDAPYAAISESLLANSRDQETGMMTIRCIVTSGDIKYVSGTLNVGLSNEKATEVSGTIPPKSSSAFAARRALVGSTARAGDGEIAEEAFQIEVSYIYWNNSPLDEVVRNLHGQSAADTFTVTLLPSVAYDGTKEHPIKPGYKPYVRDDSATENYIEYTALENPNDPYSEQTHKYVEAEPIVFENEKVGRKILVYYIPTEVNFRVNHYIQNLENDEYRLLHTDIKMGYSDYPVGENHEYTKADQYADIAGFTDLFYDPNTRISASGNTAIDIYYDRNYYLVDFDLTLPDGQKGYGVMPLYVRYGTSLMLAEPVGPGFSFTSWAFDQVYNRIETVEDGQIHVDEEKIEDADVIDLYDTPAAMLTIKHNVDYKSNWQVATASYTIIYWRENADSTDASNKANYSVWATETKSAVSGSTVDCSDLEISDKLATNQVDGEDKNEKDFFTRANAMSDLSVVVKGDGTSSVNIYYTRNTYHIWFKGISGTCKLEEHTHGDGKCDTVMFCAREEHVHVTDCYTTTNQCGVTTEHTHNDTHGNNNSCCKIAIHTHSKSCYTVTGNNVTISNNTADNNIANTLNNQLGTNNNDEIIVQYYEGWYGWNSGYYLKVGNSWYKINNYSANNTTISIICGRIQHSANDGKCVYSCGYVEHTHSDACKLTCKKEAHTHNNNDCYSPCTKYTHTHTTTGTNRCTNNSTSNYVYALSAKYGADIADKWPTAKYVKDNINSSYNLYGWTGITGNQLVTKRVNMTSDLCDVVDHVKEGTSSTAGDSYRIVYYLFESFDQTSAASGNERQLKNNIYFDSDSRYYQQIDGLNQGLSAKTITGMKPVSTSSTNSGNNVFLYYTRNRHTITFENVGVEIYTMSDIMYEQPLNKAFFDSRFASYSGKTEQWDFVDKDGKTVKVTIPIPETPSSYEEGSVYFAGWYTTPLCADGTEYNFANDVMPDAEIKLFAKWLPTYWDVTVYQEEPKGDGDNKVLKEYKDVLFGTLLTALGGEPTRTAPVSGYIFAGWYYMDGDAEKRFDFNTMAVKHDYTIYAKWTSEVPVPYTVKYVTTIDDQEVEIADPTTGVSLAGISKSFTAKVDKDLYSGYQTGYFPESREMTHKMESEGNIITFSYSHDDDVEYAIRHVFTSPNLAKYTNNDSSTLELVWEQSVNSSSSALLTVSFRGLITNDAVTAKLAGMGYDTAAINNIWNEIITLSPDAYSKRLILEAHTTAEDNEVVFHWEARTTKAVYEVHHYYESLTKEGVYEELSDPQRFEVIEGSNVEFDKLLIKGYQYSNYKTNHKDNDQVTTVFKPTVGSDGEMGDGLIISVFYDRETYNYTIKFYDDELNTPIPEVEEIEQSAKYGTKITISDVALAIDGYQLSNGSVVQELTYDNQEIICEYTRLSIKYEYIIDGVGGSFNNFQETVLFGDTPKAITLYLVDGYIIDGWSYSIDGATFEELTSAQATISADGKTLQPVTPTAEYVGKTIYIKVKVVATILTIQNSGSLDDEQGFIYVITNKTSGASVRVAVLGNTSTTVCGMLVGNYTVTLEDEWSWRYNTAIAVNDSGNTLSSNDLSWEFSFDGDESITVSYSDPNENYITDNSHN